MNTDREMQSKEKISFVVVSCDKYKDLWDVFFHSFFKYWPDCPYEVYLVTNHLNYPSEKVHTIKIGEDGDYGTNLRKICDQIPTDWFVYWFEDTPFSKPLDTTRIDKLLTTAQNENAGSCLLVPTYPVVYLKNKTKLLGSIPKNVKYRAAIGASLYNKKTFKKLILEGKTAWEHDKNSEPNNWDDKFLALNSSINEPFFPYAHGVIKGKWCYQFHRFLKKEGFSNLISEREKESIFSFLYGVLYMLRIKIFKFLKIHWYE